MATPISVSDLVATPGIANNTLQWSVTDPHVRGFPYLSLDAVEVWAATTNNRASATKVAEGATNAVHMGLVEGSTWYYWIKPRSRHADYGDWYPSGATSGIQATVVSSGNALVNGKVVATASAGALTIAVKTLAGTDPSPTNPVFVSFPTSSGSYVVRAITSALSFTLPSGATMGYPGTMVLRIWAAIFDDGGTLRIAARNCTFRDSSGTQNSPVPRVGFDDAFVESGSGTSDNVFKFYANADMFFKAFRLIGFFEWFGLATPGTWTNPNLTRDMVAGMPAPGDAVKSIAITVNDVLTSSALIPYDNTVPQDTEGYQLFSTFIWVDYNANLVEAHAAVHVAHSVVTVAIAALFHGGSSNAIAATMAKVPAADAPVELSITHLSQAGGTGAQQYTLNVGGSDAGTLTINGAGGAGKLGGSLHRYLRLTEIMA